MRWQNLLALVVGIALGLAPWLLGFADDTPIAGWIVLVCAAIVIVLASVAIERPVQWPHWLLALTGIWLSLSPVALRFEDDLVASAIAIGGGTALMLLASVSLLGSIGRSPPVERRTGRAPRIGAFRARLRERPAAPAGRHWDLAWWTPQSDAGTASDPTRSRGTGNGAASRASPRRRSSR